MKLKNNLCVVSLTHWDREWRFPFQKTRMLLVKMMDGVLATLDGAPDYACFHLDGHTILLEDYCEVRPENAARIRRYVEQRRLLIGPWYVLPEENQISGESLVRNLLWGERVGRAFGGVMKVGYSPTSWGQVSQIPQIMQGFDIQSTIFYRGITADQAPGHYYVWEGADGSRLFAIRLGDYARASFFHLVDRPVVFNRGRSDQSHDWTLGGKPFRLCGTGSDSPYQFYQPPSGWHPERIDEAFAELEDVDLGVWETPFALAMECDDSTGPFVLTPKIIEEARKRIANDKTIVHGNLPEFIESARAHLANADLPVVKGEMRHPQRAGIWTDLYAEVQATRMPLKYANRRAEFALQRVAEPLAAIAWTLGCEYPQFALDRAWKLLLQNHAHDSIGGCGVDAVADEVAFRFRQVEILAGTVAEDAAREIAGRIDTRGCAAGDILLVVFNHLPRPRSGVARAEVDIALDRGVRGIKVCDMDGADIHSQVIGKSEFLATFNHPQELPLRTRSNRWEFYFDAADVPALGYKVFKVIPADEEERGRCSLLAGPAAMENEFLRVSVNPNGTVDVTNKADGAQLSGQNYFEDRGDVGDYWIGAFPKRDRVITSLGSAARIAIKEDGPLAAAIEIEIDLDLPVSSTRDISAREAETRPVRVACLYRLVRGERFLRIRTTVENTVEDHILRALFPTGLETDTACAEAPFDVVARPIPLPDTRGWREPYKPVQPHRSFVDVSDGARGVALLNRGLTQYEAVDDRERTIALTLFRAHRSWNSVRLAHYPDQTGTQLRGTHTFEYALLPHKGGWDEGDVQREAEWFNLSFSVGAAGPGEGTLAQTLSFVEIEGRGLVLDALKKGEWDDSLVIRLSNPTARDIDGAIFLQIQPAAAEAVNLMETKAERELPVRGGRIAVHLPAKKILTVRIVNFRKP